MTGRLKVYDADTGTWRYVDVAVLPVTSGTSFPTGPAVNDRFWRTDLRMEFFWDGTNWLTTTLYTGYIPMQTVTEPMSATNYIRGPIPIPWATSYYVEQFWTQVYVSTLNNASNYWTINSFGATVSTAALAITTVATLVAAINAVLNNPLANWHQVTMTRVGTAGTLYVELAYSYRIVGPP